MPKYLNVKKGDWILMKGSTRVWLVDDVNPRGVMNDGSAGRVLVTLHDAAGMMGANFPLKNVARLARQRELLASEAFRVGYMRELMRQGSETNDTGFLRR